MHIDEILRTRVRTRATAKARTKAPAKGPQPRLHEDEGTRKGPPASPDRPCLYSIKGLFKKAIGVRTLTIALSYGFPECSNKYAL